MVSPGQTWDCHLTLGASMKSINLHKLAKNFAKTRYGSWGGPPWCSFSPCLAAASLTYFHRSHQESWCRPYLKHWVRLFGFDGFRWLETVDFTMGWYHTNGWGLRPAQCLAPTTRPPHLLLARPVCRGQLCTLVSQCLEKIPYFCKACCDRFVAAEGLVTKPAKYSRWWRNVSPAPPLMWCCRWFHPEEKTNFLLNSVSRKKFDGAFVSDWDRLKEAKPPWQRGRGRRGRWKIQSSFSYHHDNHSHD